MIKIIKIKKAGNKSIAKKAASISLLSILFLGLAYFLFSPEIISISRIFELNSNSASRSWISVLSPFSTYPSAFAATTASVVVSVVVGKEVMITAPSNFTLTGTIGGVTGGTASGTAAFSVLNSSQAGFAMSIKASSAPALATGSYTFVDYAGATVTGTPSYSWTAPAAGTSGFGFSVGASGTSGVDAVARFKYSGSTCNSGTTNAANLCWAPFNGTTAVNVVSTSSFSSTAVTENIILQAAFTNNNINSIAADTYQATITATVATN